MNKEATEMLLKIDLRNKNNAFQSFCLLLFKRLVKLQERKGMMA